MLSQNFTFRVSPELREKIDQTAAEEGRRPGALVRLLLSDAITRRRGLLSETAVPQPDQGEERRAAEAQNPPKTASNGGKGVRHG